MHAFAVGPDVHVAEAWGDDGWGKPTCEWIGCAPPPSAEVMISSLIFSKQVAPLLFPASCVRVRTCEEPHTSSQVPVITACPASLPIILKERQPDISQADGVGVIHDSGFQNKSTNSTMPMQNAPRARTEEESVCSENTSTLPFLIPRVLFWRMRCCSGDVMVLMRGDAVAVHKPPLRVGWLYISWWKSAV